MASHGKNSDENVKDAVRRRGIIKGKLTRFGTFFNGFLKSDKRNFTELKLRCDKLNTLYDEFDAVQTEIEEFDESTAQLSERTIFENDFFAIQAAASEECENHRRSNVSTSTQPYQQNDSQLFQLPRISLPEFSGGYENWQSFRDNFMVMVDKKNIAPVQKLQYLRMALSGSAAQLINSLDITDVNYQVAWELLTKRFENKRLIVQSHLSKLFAVQRLAKESATELRFFYDTFTSHLGALKAVGEKVDGWSTPLVFLAASKLDARSLMEWEVSRTDTSVPTWSELDKFLSHRCHTLDAVEVSKRQFTEPSNQLSTQGARKSFITFQDNSVMTDETTTKCYVCKKPHPLYQCSEFLEMRTPDKVKTARAANVCVNCLRSGHRASACRSSSCQKCNKRHNSKLHLEEEEREEAFSNNMILVQQTYNEIESSSEEQEEAVVCKAQISIDGDRTGKEVAMLSTAIIIINDVRNEKVTARVLLDSGSQVNLMTMKLATKLGYPIKSTNITIRGVSGNSCTPIGEITASIKSRLNAFEASLQFLVMQNVACTLPTVYPEKNIMKVINSKEYADPDVCSMRKIDMIVGTQLFFRLLCIGQIRPAGTDAIWQKTVFGWILSGHITSTNQMHCLSITASQIEPIQKQVQKFWELEEIVKSSPVQVLSMEEKKMRRSFFKHLSERGKRSIHIRITI